MDSKKSEGLNIIILEVEETLKNAVDVKNIIEEYKRISIRGRFKMWAKEFRDFSYKFLSVTGEGVYANIKVDSSKNLG